METIRPAGSGEAAAHHPANPSMVRVGTRERLSYGFGEFASSLIWTALSAFAAYYYTDVVGLSAAAVGTLLLIARLLDAFADVGIGILVDKTKSRHGKARPWLLWLAVPYGVAGVLLFSVPDLGPVGTLVYAYISYLLVNIIFSGINIPFSVLNVMITQEPYERSMLNVVRTIFASVGGIVVTFFTMPLVRFFGGGKLGWLLTFVMFGVFSTGFFLLTFFGTKERVKPSVVQKDVPVKRAGKALLRNKYWALLAVFALFTFIGNAASTGINVYYAQHVLQNTELVGTIGLASLLPILIGLFFLPLVIKRIGKRNACLIGISLTVAGSLAVAFDPANITLVLTGTVIKAIGTVPIVGTIFAMLADTVDYGEWKTGIRSEGLVYSATTFGSKAGTGIGAAVVSWVLAWSGYLGGQAVVSASVQSSIQFLFIYLPVLIGVIQIAILAFYKLDKEYPQIIQELTEAKDI
ncbi:glycoside-pentoside-hexuronide (GPH):cation symporter [Paenibacillus chitinolyticus]|uniref:MFS transporter n=1 Tax=Paenibacillus chitinolyticus TaxID=79263 RepID=UPI002DBC6720|nr:MFS transporter [Paenibacillus chitinolyticus]MEC0244390.1 MFS transporter [Paenibacillus chitinolyticus]